jgi:muconate cycloisomerase
MLKIAKAGDRTACWRWPASPGGGVGLYGGTMLEGTVGTVASLHAWSTLPLQWGTEMFGPLLLKDDIVSVPLTFADGQVALPQTPGLAWSWMKTSCASIPVKHNRRK